MMEFLELKKLEVKIEQDLLGLGIDIQIIITKEEVLQKN